MGLLVWLYYQQPDEVGVDIPGKGELQSEPCLIIYILYTFTFHVFMSY